MANEPLGCLGAFFKLLGVGGQNATRDTEQENLPYRLRDDFLSAAELDFFHALKQVVGEHFHICSKVRISDLLYVANRRENLGHANRIDRKHVDFVLCDPKTMQPALVVELDDSSHQRKDRRDRDELVDAAFHVAGMPILHVTCRRSYVQEELEQQIRTAIKPEEQEVPPIAPTLTSEAPVDAEVVPEVPHCPKCHVVMIERVASRGRHRGKRFWACPSYPDCRKIVAID